MYRLQKNAAHNEQARALLTILDVHLSACITLFTVIGVVAGLLRHAAELLFWRRLERDPLLGRGREAGRSRSCIADATVPGLSVAPAALKVQE